MTALELDIINGAHHLVWNTFEAILRRNNATEEQPMVVGGNEFWIDNGQVCFLRPGLDCIAIANLVAKEPDSREVTA